MIFGRKFEVILFLNSFWNSLSLNQEIPAKLDGRSFSLHKKFYDDSSPGLRLFRRFDKWSLRRLDSKNHGLSYLRYTRCFCRVWGSIWAFGSLRTQPASDRPRKICKKISVLQRHVASRGWKMFFFLIFLVKEKILYTALNN